MTRILRASVAGSIDRAAEELAGGLVIALPTDTVYGIAVAPTVPGATDRLFAAKGRPRAVVLPVLVASVADVDALAVVTPAARLLMDRFWPGALTLVMRRAPGVDFDLGDEGTTIGLRCPADPVARAVCEVAGPIATTSANRHGEPTATDADGVVAALGDTVALVLDDGPRMGMASTVADCTGHSPTVLREGALAWSHVLAALA